MAVITEKDFGGDALMDTARRMAVAARTAPKARGVNHMDIMILTGNDVLNLANVMQDIGEKEDNPIFLRDAGNVRSDAGVVLLVGTKIQPLGLQYCGLCGFVDCTAKGQYPDVPCAFNTGDLGIAVGSAVSVAMDARIDNRIMYTIGMAAKKMGLLGEAYKVIYGIPLSASSKNPFFDRSKK